MAFARRTSQPSVVVIGAGIGGLAAAAAIARAGIPVTVLEAHVYPGGCAATFRHRGHWYDAGATLLAGFAPGGPMQLLGRAAGIRQWPVRSTELAMTVYLDDGTVIPRVASEARWDIYRSAFPTSLAFWHWQERTAAWLWDFALRLPEIQPRSWTSFRDTLAGTAAWPLQSRPSPRLLIDLFRPLARRLPDDPRFRRFVDAQLLIAAQATADDVYALYGAAALDLPNRGVVEPTGGSGAIAWTLVEAVRRHGGTVHFRQEVVEIERTERAWRIRTQRGLELAATHLVADLTPWALARLWRNAPAALRRRTERPPAGWSAFLMYLSLDASRIPPNVGSHHQVLAPGSLGEGNSVFVSLSPRWDTTRAPAGIRVATLSTHTAFASWWKLARTDFAAYRELRAFYAERLLATAARALPWLRAAVREAIPGTPLAIARFTRRPWGWVGGFPQRHLFVAWPSEVAPHLWLVGDSVFPGQSIPATALAGLRVARALLRSVGAELRLEADEPAFLPVEPETPEASATMPAHPK